MTSRLLVLALLLLGAPAAAGEGPSLAQASPAVEVILGKVTRLTPTELIISFHDKGANMARWRFKLEKPLEGIQRGDAVKVTYRRQGDDKIVVKVEPQ